jgi:hypothetical protein
MSTPILTRALAFLEEARYYAKSLEKDGLCELAITDAYSEIQNAISQIQGAREDAHRMSGRVTLDTELLDMLAPKEAQE